ncbi:MAG: DUF6049 family protein [Nocardioidaceae bacterium]
MMAPYRSATSLLFALVVSILLWPAATSYAEAPAPTAVTKAPNAHPTPALSVTIDNIDPLSLQPGKPLRLTGVVTNHSTKTWAHAQVYLVISYDPATTKAGLDQFGAVPDDQAFGNMIVTIGLFAEIGDLPAGARRPYELSIPFAKLPISRAPGVYHVGVNVLATAPNGTRDNNSDARADTLVPMLPKNTSKLPLEPALTLVPITAPVHRQSDGSFVDDDLAAALRLNGRLRHELDFVKQSAPGSIEMAVDPNLLLAIHAMSKGYLVRSIAQIASGEHGSRGSGRRDALSWLSEFNQVTTNQYLLLLPWGNPDLNSMSAYHMTDVIKAAISASKQYASAHKLDAPVAGWAFNGMSSQRSIALTQQAGAPFQVIAARTLPGLSHAYADAYPPGVMQLPTPYGPARAVVTTSQLAGEALTTHSSPLELRQQLIAEATVRSLVGQAGKGPAVAALPFGWDPGPTTSMAQQGPAASFPTLTTQNINAAFAGGKLASYSGPVRIGSDPAQLAPELIAGIAQLRARSGTYTSMLSDPTRQLIAYHQQLAFAASTVWRFRPALGLTLVQQRIQGVSRQIAKVTVTGSPFVALSGQSGRFPLTVTNGLDVPVTVKLDVQPVNPALKISPIPTIVLDPGQRRDIDVISNSDGSGVTTVQARLATRSGQPFGKGWRFQVRATQIGLVIWVVMGAGGVVLFGVAGYRIYQRLRTGRVTGRST